MQLTRRSTITSIFNFIRDIAPVAGVVRFPMVVTVHSSFPAKTLPEFLASATATPGKINIGTPGIGSPQHVAGELFKMMTGANIVLIAYRGGLLPSWEDDGVRSISDSLHSRPKYLDDSSIQHSCLRF
jgi:tripartite-type tricarboxylate transporter receptor subunit TctC